MEVRAASASATRGAPFSDTFDSYDLGNLDGQGGWQYEEVPAWLVTDQGCPDGSGRCITAAGVRGTDWKLGTDLAAGSWSVRFNVRSEHNTWGLTRLYFGSSVQPDGSSELDIASNPWHGIFITDNRGNIMAQDLAFDVWHTLTYTWDMTNPTDCRFSVQVDTAAPVGSAPSLGTPLDCYTNVYQKNIIGSLGLFTYLVGPDNISIDDVGSEATTTAPAIVSLQQADPSGAPIAEGASFLNNSITFSAAASSTIPLELEVELKPSGVPFDGNGTLLSATSTSGTLSMTASDLIPFAQQYAAGGGTQSFHWRARLKDMTTGLTSDWQEFGVSGNTDFTAKVVPLWTQVSSNYPPRSLLQEWSDKTYASGIDHTCGDKTNGYKATIGTCGCLITSFVMLSHYYDIEQGVDGSDVTPLTFNNWLEAHGGYVDVRHGGTIDENLLDFNAARRYFGVIQDGKSYSWLQYHTNPATNSLKITDQSVFDGYLDALEPGILYNASVGHFFVATQKLVAAGTYALRDPYFYNTQTLNDASDPPNHVHAYHNVFSYAIVPSKLSTPKQVVAYTTLYLASPAEILVTDSQGRREGKDPRTGMTYNEIPYASYDLSDPIATSETPLDPSALPDTKILVLPTNAGMYTIEVIGTGSGTYQLTAAMTTDSGTTTTKVFTASTTPGAVVDYLFAPATQTITLTPEEILSALTDTIQHAGLKSVTNALLAHVQNIKTAYQKDKDSTGALIQAMSTQVAQLRGIQIPVATADTLLSLLSDLQKSI